MTVGLKTRDDVAGLEFPIRVQLTRMHRQLPGNSVTLSNWLIQSLDWNVSGYVQGVRLDPVISGQQEYSVTPKQVKLCTDKRRRKAAA